MTKADLEEFSKALRADIDMAREVVLEKHPTLTLQAFANPSSALVEATALGIVMATRLAALTERFERLEKAKETA